MSFAKEAEVTFCFASDDVSEVKLLVAGKFSYTMTSECVSGHLNIFNWKVMLTILHMTLPITPVYTAILIVRKLTIARLRAERIMSENRKQLHAQLLKVLKIEKDAEVEFPHKDMTEKKEKMCFDLVKFIYRRQYYKNKRNVRHISKEAIRNETNGKFGMNRT
ncbi:hypothetical protein TELCIR_06801 [Teladorsagia circumcincta]|uniref:Uncharacterized protein n=1 Tax=Teladorsagia circumcincta TaxID=45464 RepID=A0A2G9UM17_TELCI|nr:hypothetical protein TELCIR_06801 [Teladorsagia circumcincta]